MESLDLTYDAAGLVTVVAQDRLSGEIRMLAHANRDALEQTLKTREAHFFSRSRHALWKKGETSGHTMQVSEVWVDCDRDAVIYLVEPEGPSCHTGEATCFFERLDESAGEVTCATPTLSALKQIIEKRGESSREKSYTKLLLERGVVSINEKIAEESAELIRALSQESDERVASEAADLLFHMLVGLQARGVAWRDVLGVLDRRMGVSGHDEKARRHADKG